MTKDEWLGLMQTFLEERIEGARNDMTTDEWLGLIQTFLEKRMEDAPDLACKLFAHSLWKETAEILDEQEP